MKEIVYEDSNIYGKFVLYRDYMKFDYKALGMGKAKEYIIKYNEVKSFEFTNSGTIPYKFLHIELISGENFNFYIKKKMVEEWEEHLNSLLSKNNLSEPLKKKVRKSSNDEKESDDLMILKDNKKPDNVSEPQEVITNVPTKGQNNSNMTKVIIFIAIIIGMVIIINSCVNSADSPASTITWDIRQMDATLGYGTKYEIGEIINVSCKEEENDSQGRYIVRCNLEYYPKRNSGAIATDSKMHETIYAVMLRKDKEHFSRLYTSSITDSFKAKVCWGKDKSEGITCSTK